MTVIRHPEVHVKLVGEDGNAYRVIGAVQRALQDAGVPEDEVSLFTAEAIISDYDNVLRTCMKWVDVS
jgi:hypothetical protein